MDLLSIENFRSNIYSLSKVLLVNKFNFYNKEEPNDFYLSKKKTKRAKWLRQTVYLRSRSHLIKKKALHMHTHQGQT